MRTGLLLLAILLLLPIRNEWATASQRDDVPGTQAIVTAPKYYVLETLTVYNPVAGQCDDTPLITASNARIDLDKLKLSEIRWMALSRNLLKKWNGEFNYGDTVLVHAGDPEIDGLWVVNDNMNKRFKDRGDLLFHQAAKRTGMWKNVKIARWDPKAVATGQASQAG